MKKLYLLIGFGLGALFVWALTHNDRIFAQFHREEETRMREFDKAMQVEQAMFEAVHGPSRVSQEDVEAEIRKYIENPFWEDEEDEEN